MKWTPEAEAAVKKAPFFVRKKIRARVEKEATAEGKAVITPAEVEATRRRFLANMSAEIKGYQVDACFGPSGCPNKAVEAGGLLKAIEEYMESADLLGFLKATVEGDLKFHHEFRITLAECPNACSQPQIKDIGIIGARVPRSSVAECSQCGACEGICREEAISLETHGPVVLGERCLSCGQCVVACPTGALETGKAGFRIQVGGKLGRHPRLARELPGIHDEKTVLSVVRYCVDFLKTRSKNGRRFGEAFTDADFEKLRDRLEKGAV